MSCKCGENKKIHELTTQLPQGRSIRGYIREAIKLEGIDVELEAKVIGLERCYLCAKKHVVAAKTLFREFHTGYSNHIKNLINSLRISEDKVREAFILWQDIMGELNMGEAELLGNSEQPTIDAEHVRIANLVRQERIRLSDDPLYVPKFDDLLVAIHTLQFSIN